MTWTYLCWIQTVTGNHIKQLNSASSDSELHRFRTKPLSNSLTNMAALNSDVLFKQQSLDRDSMTSSKGLLFSPIGLKHNVTEKVAQVGGLVRIIAFLHSAWLTYLVDLKLLLAAKISNAFITNKCRHCTINLFKVYQQCSPNKNWR